MRLFDIAEVYRVDTAALSGDDGWLLMAKESPRRGAEKGVRFDVRSASARAQATEFVLD